MRWLTLLWHWFARDHSADAEARRLKARAIAQDIYDQEHGRE